MTDLRGHAVVSLLRDGDIRRVWAVGLFAGVGRWLEMLVAGIYAFDVTGSPMLVALLILLRMTPFALFGPLVGALADRLPPRLLLAVGLSCASAVSGTVLMFFLLEIDAYWVVALACFLAGLIWCSDMPLRRRLLGDIASLAFRAELETAEADADKGTPAALTITASLGLASFDPKTSTTADELRGRAERALREAKERGGNGMVEAG